MKKFNGFERHLLETGLNLVMDQMKDDICKIEASGKNPLMTKDYVDMIFAETLEKLISFSKKEKKYGK